MHIDEIGPDARRIYLIGICGTAMASLAGMLKSRGFEVTGSDEHVYPPMSTYLANLGIRILDGYTGEHLDKFRPNLVIVGNAIARTNAEASWLLEHDLPFTSMPEAIYQLFIRGKHSVVVAGTHGKTTTTSLMAWILEAAGRDPCLVVGGIPLNFGQNFKLGSGKEFVIEGDEYNTAFFDKGPKFVHYHPDTLILNNVEFDHADIYDDLDAILASFRKVLEGMADDGLVVANGDDANVMGLRGACRAEWLTFGFGAQNALTARGIDYGSALTRFEVVHDGRSLGVVASPLSGPHNVLNTLAVIGVALSRGLGPDEIAEGLRGFRGIKRRMEIRGVERGVTVIDDFAHHPTAVGTTLRGARDMYPGRRIWALFEPRSISSVRREFQSGYEEAFLQADRVVIGPVFHRERYLTRYGIEKMMSIDGILEAVRGADRVADHFDSFDPIVDLVGREAREGDVVILMSSGAFGGIHERILERLKA
jgi:UDP-N-acetylmuramate: L-alanyl-gamma-D-glutamyl-meso-diaminopimelate ligase